MNIEERRAKIKQLNDEVAESEQAALVCGILGGILLLGGGILYGISNWWLA